jgi:MOSC domain-containing protein YiiM
LKKETLLQAAASKATGIFSALALIHESLTVVGVPLDHLVGSRFRVGDSVLVGGRLNFPCRYLEKLLCQPVYLPLYNRSGLNCRIEQGGTVRRGDPVEPLND